MSIRYKTFLILLLLTLSSHFIITSIYYFYSQNTVKSEAVKSLQSMADVQQERLNTFIDSNMEKLRLINSRTPLLISIKHYNKTKNEESLLFIKEILSDAIKNSQSIEDIFILSPDGKTVASAHDKYPHQSYKKELHLLKKSEKPFVNYFVNDMKSTKILFSTPLILDNEFHGVLIMQVKMDSLYKHLQDYKGLGKTGEVLMALDYDDKEMLFFTPLRFSKSPLLIQKGSKTAKPMMLALEDNETILEDNVLDYRNEPVIAVTRYLDRLKFGIVVKMDKAEVFQASTDLRLLILELITLLILIVLTGSIILSNIITKPVIDITNVATQISHGDFEKRVKILSKDELGALGNALNTMADKLINANRTLEQEVQARTEELCATNKELEKLSQTDGLTGVANRAKFDTYLEESYKRSKRYQKPLSLLILDIDYFKAVNDYYGHQTGDEYLKKLAQVLKNIASRVDDLAARYGGEEFALILEDTDLEGAVAIAQKILQSVLDLNLDNPHSTVEKHLTVSIGVATTVPTKDMKIDTASFIKKADDALYKAKKSGRNKIVSTV